MVTVVNRDPLSIKFQVSDDRYVVVYGYNDRRAPEESLLINGGTSRITKVEDVDWEIIKEKYAHLGEFKFNVIYAMEKEKDAKAKAKELVDDFEHLQMSEKYRKSLGDSIHDYAEVE